MYDEILKTGTKLNNRYIIKSVIGRGGFGIMYCAFDKLLDSFVAIKELFVEGCMHRDVEKSNEVVFVENQRERFEKYHTLFIREIEIMKVIKNVPYVSRIRDNFQENGTEYIVMRLLRGQSLMEYAKQETFFDPKVVFRPVEQLLIGIEKMHELGIIHRDISPGNLFLTEDGDIYLIDFGTAMAFDETSELWNSDYFEHRGFHSPEYKEPEQQGPWTDIYSLCATLYYMIIGMGIPDAVDRMQYDDIPQNLMRCVLSKQQQNALIYGLQIDLEKRCKTAQDLRISMYGEMEKDAFYENVSYSASTNIGSRNVNQDNLLLDGLFYYEGRDFERSGIISCGYKELHMVAVCDGVGGANAGELASRAAAQALNHFLEQYRHSEILPERLIEELMDQINEKIITLGKKIGQTATTISFLLWKGNQYYIVNIGDSPIFRLRKRTLKQMSVPHTLAMSKEMEGLEITIKDRHTLLNYLGKEKVAGSQMIAYRHGYIESGDTFLLCTDGVTNKIDTVRLKKIMSKSETAAMAKINKIMKRNIGNDNYTSVIVKF